MIVPGVQVGLVQNDVVIETARAVEPKETVEPKEPVTEDGNSPKAETLTPEKV
jgi:hypothetical protein